MSNYFSIRPANLNIEICSGKSSDPNNHFHSKTYELKIGNCFEKLLFRENSSAIHLSQDIAFASARDSFPGQAGARPRPG